MTPNGDNQVAEISKIVSKQSLPGIHPSSVKRMFRKTMHEHILSRARNTATGGKRIAYGEKSVVTEEKERSTTDHDEK